MSAPEASIVIATYNRPDSLLRILGEIEKQTVAADRFEVVVVDDGSKEEVAPRLGAFANRLALTVKRQKNGGAAAARQHGAEIARGTLLVFVDDDMVLPPEFLESHLSRHLGPTAKKNVVMGRLRADQKLADMPLFERFYALMLDRIAGEVQAGTFDLRGPSLYTGNLSLRRDLFFAAGGFDTSFGQIEDAELGVRLEKLGATFILSEEAYTVHASDHTSRDRWFARTVKDGKFWTRLARKHPEAVHANPWRHLTAVNPLSRPVLALVVALPKLALPMAKTAFAASQAADSLGLGRIAVAGTTLVYGIQYFQGVRSETGSLGDVFREYRAFRKGVTELQNAESAHHASLMEAVRADHAMLAKTQGKYGGKDGSSRSLAADAVNNIGFQLLILYRVMRAFRESGQGLAAKFCSRLLRHLYGSDIHWDATFEPGVVVVHGFGMAISGEAYVSEGCILFQHVTLGRGNHADTKKAGAPRLERDVHVGVGATLIGPIVVGTRTKIMPGCTLTHDVPPNTVVTSPEPELRARKAAPPEAKTH